MATLAHARAAVAVARRARRGADAAGSDLLLRVGARLDLAALWGVWLAGAGALLLASVALPAPGWSIGLLLGGSLSHTLETWRRGSVADCVVLHGWPAFDPADVALVIGAGGTLMALAVAALGTLAL